MATAPHPLSVAGSDRIYNDEIKDLHLGGVKPSTLPTVVFVGGAEGAGKTAHAPNIAAHLAAVSGTPVVVSVDDMREYHPEWQREARRDGQAAERFNEDASRWVNKLYTDAIAERKNVVLETGFKHPELLAETIVKFREAGYRVEAEIVVVSADKSKRAVAGRILDAQEKGFAPRLVTAPRFEEGYVGLRATLQHAEDKVLVDQIRLVRRGGEEIYSNTSTNGKWNHEPAAVAALDRERDRPMTPTELANNAIAWHQLSTRAQLQPDTPVNVLTQIAAWRKESSTLALADPDAQKQYEQKIAGESFRTMPRVRFLREFPHYAGAVERMDAAEKHASAHYATPQDRALFTAQTRAHLAAQIDDGRQFDRIKVSEALPRTSVERTRADDAPTR